VEAALSEGGRREREPLARVEISSLSDERRRIVAQVLAGVLVARAIVELGVLTAE